MWYLILSLAALLLCAVSWTYGGRYGYRRGFNEANDAWRFFQLNTPLSELSDLQAQEHMAAPTHIEIKVAYVGDLDDAPDAVPAGTPCMHAGSDSCDECDPMQRVRVFQKDAGKTRCLGCGNIIAACECSGGPLDYARSISFPHVELPVDPSARP